MSEDLRYYFFDHEADDNPSIPSDEGWKQMKQLLDKELPLVTKRKPRRYLFFGIAAIAGVILLTTALPLQNYFEQKNKMLDATRNLHVTAAGHNEIKQVDQYTKLPGQKTVEITKHLQVIKEQSLQLQSIPELNNAVQLYQNQDQRKVKELAGNSKIDNDGAEAIDTFSNPIAINPAVTKRETAKDYSEKKKTSNSNYKKWQINAGIASNISFSNTLKGLQPYPVAEVRYQFSPLFFAGTSVGLFSTVGSNANGVKKTVYINDMSINVSNYAERIYYERLSYADISLAAGFKLNSHLSAQTGIQFSRLLNTKTTTKIEPYDFDMNLVRIQDTNTLQPNPSAAPVYNKNVEPRKLDMRYVAGINYDLKKISFGLQYQAGVNSILKGDAVSNDKNKMITLKATYRFK